MSKTNELFSSFMGYEKVVVGYFGCDDETTWQVENKEWLDEMQIESVGTYAVNVKENLHEEWDDLAYFYSWDWFMPVWKKASNEIIGSDYVKIKSKICMAICDVNIENACKYLSELITSHLKMQK